MLNIQDIVSRVEQPSNCSIEDIDDLLMMTEKFPYSQLFPILYLKALSNRRDIRFEEELGKYAYLITDRVQLYNLVQKTNSLSAEKDSLSNTVSENRTEFSEISKATVSKTTSEDEYIDPAELKGIYHIGEEKPEIETTDAESEEVEVIPLNIRGNETPIETTIEEDNSDGDFEKGILAETISSAYEFALSKSVSTAIEEYNTSATDSNRINEDETHENDSLDDFTNKRSFNSWLRSNVNSKQDLFDEEKARIDSIMEHFIENQPSITRPSKSQDQEERPKTEFYSAAKKAK
jgi:hypothetical protein